jgi:(1->4)-alpha-D-glucan 1-alpha-D-glucosylmutase
MPATGLPPASTYRVQLSSSFTFDDLSREIPYLADLGITDIYLSPIHAARPGTTHGYDIVDHTRIDPQLGGEPGWMRFREIVRAHRLGVILDVVPNHMAADPVHNLLWRRMLAEGPISPAARHFDVDWRPLTGMIRDKVLLPVLDEPYGSALIHGKVVLEETGKGYRVRIGDVHLPLANDTVEASGMSAGELNADPQRLHDLLERQYYRLAFWRAANDEINYRRFFDVNHLVAIRAEDDEVFRHSHSLIFRLAQDSEVVRGLRIDHVDGLLDPTTYLQRLRSDTDRTRQGRTWIVVEKILERSETLDTSWPVDGTTGYDSLNVLNRLFISGRGVRALRRFYHQLLGERVQFKNVAYESKELVMKTTLRSGLTLLAHAIKRVADASWTTRDITLNAISTALVEFIACLPVYRTYLHYSEERRADRDVIEHAFSEAIRRTPSLDPTALTFLRSLMLGESDQDPFLASARRGVVMRLQQYTSSVQAKGIEDTAYYRDNTLLALNEVGGDPERASGSVGEFHRFNIVRQRRWPDAHNSTSTHDTKLGEDTRIRIAALSSFAAEWTSAVRCWRSTNAFLRPDAASIHVNDEYRLYQALVGMWPANEALDGRPAPPALVDRAAAYIEKAMREAAERTSWMRVNREYEIAVDTFVRGALTDPAASGFRKSMRELVQLILPLSTTHSISQLVLKCLMPGVPDIYQGDESWALCVTDPDNRRQVNFGELTSGLARVTSATESVALAQLPLEDLKQHVATRLLRFRRDNRSFMARARYSPIRARGQGASLVVGFRRSFQDQHLVVAVPRLVDRELARTFTVDGRMHWSGAELPLPSAAIEWTNVLSGGRVETAGARAPVRQLAGGSSWVVLYGRT